MPEYAEDSLSRELLAVQRTLGWMDIVLGSIKDAVYVTDSDGRIVFANQHFSDLLSQPRVFLLGKNLTDIFEPQLLENPQKEFLASPAAPIEIKDSEVNVYNWHNDGELHVFKISCRYIETIQQTVYIATDITEEYGLSVMKTNFINIASHQLRTPMTSIMTYAHMLDEGIAGELDISQKKFTRTIISSSERMIRLINDILLITRIQNGETNLLAKDALFSEVLGAVESEVSGRLSQKKIKLTTSYNPGAIKAKCNAFVTHEIIMNIVTNAIQYTPNEGSIKIRSSLQSDSVKISVTDNGIGIPKENIETIYDQFARADNAMEVFGEGTGLGLYVVKILMSHIKGDILCTSKVNEGTTFKLLFPV